MVFDLQRFALHDGPGIRTTIFLKGCPLDCLWCHNPESKSNLPQICFFEKKCVCCGECVKACPRGAHIIDSNGKHRVKFRECKGCGKCVDVCPAKALKLFGKKYSTDELLKVLVRDKDFYERSGGGLTVSGGEPMLQIRGLLELLSTVKKEGIHICLDTSGFAKNSDYQKIAPFVDLFLFDYKLTAKEEHIKYTGVSNELILENLDWLCTHGSKVALRCPIIPGINDNDTHYSAIAEISERYDGITEVDLMTYHDMAKGKTAQIGMPYPLENIKTVTEEEKYRIYERVEKLGCKKLGVG